MMKTLTSVAAGLGAAVLAAVVLAALCLPGTAGAETYLIDKNGGGDFLNFADGIAAAADGDTLLVASGGYGGDNNKNLDFGGKNLSLIARDGPGTAYLYGGGGFSGAQIFRLANGEDERTVIDGFLIKDGRSDSLGGLVYLNGASPIFRNCEFRDGRAPSGGGVYCANASPSFFDCAFRKSFATAGDGAGACFLDSSPSFTRCNFFENYAEESGGGACFVSSIPQVEECAISLNDAREDGGGFAFFDCPAGSAVDLCTFRQNESRRGAGMSFVGGTEVVITDCMMNVGNAYLQGSNVFCGSGSAPSFERSLLSFGLHGEAIYCEEGAAPSFLHCVIGENAAGDSLCANREDNIFADPLYCDFYALNYDVCLNSPCLPANNPWGARVGNRESGCGSCDSPVEATSWGAIKALFR